MISDEEKDKIKADIVNKVNSVLEKNGESFRMDKWQEKIQLRFRRDKHFLKEIW